MEKYFTLAAAGAAALLFAGPAQAEVYFAPSDSGDGRVILLEPLTFVHIDDLDFGGFLVPSSGSDTVSIDAVSGVVTNGASLTRLPQFTQMRGRFMGAGTALQGVTVVTAFPTKLFLDGNTASPESIDVSLELDGTLELDGSYTYVLPGDGVLDVHVGGDLTISSGMQPGVYSNTFDLTATYQ